MRDDAYEKLSEKTALLPNDRLNNWFGIANSFEVLPSLEDTDSLRFHEMKRIATSHMLDLVTQSEQTEQIERYNNQRVRLFVTTHKNVNRFESDIMHLCRLACTKAAIVSPGRSTMTKARISPTVIRAIAS